MKRSELKRTPFKPKESTGLLRVAAVQKTRAKKCKQCRQPFVPRNLMARACSPGCAVLLAVNERMARERKQDRERKHAMKTRQQWLKEAQAEVNALVRYRDRDDGCISCEKPASWAGQWHASHYKSIGSAPALRFDLANIHKACSVCNNHLSGNIGAYTPRILAKIGQSELDRLNGPQEPKKYSIEEIAAIKAAAKAELKSLKEK